MSETRSKEMLASRFESHEEDENIVVTESGERYRVIKFPDSVFKHTRESSRRIFWNEKEDPYTLGEIQESLEIVMRQYLRENPDLTEEEMIKLRRDLTGRYAED